MAQQLRPSQRAERPSIGSLGLPQHAQATVQYLWSVINPLEQKGKVTLNCTHRPVWFLKRQPKSTSILSSRAGNWEEVGLSGILVRLWVPEQELGQKAYIVLNIDGEYMRGELSDLLLCHYMPADKKDMIPRTNLIPEGN